LTDPNGWEHDFGGGDLVPGPGDFAGVDLGVGSATLSGSLDVGGLGMATSPGITLTITGDQTVADSFGAGGADVNSLVFLQGDVAVSADALNASSLMNVDFSGKLSTPSLNAGQTTFTSSVDLIAGTNLNGDLLTVTMAPYITDPVIGVNFGAGSSLTCAGSITIEKLMPLNLSGGATATCASDIPLPGSVASENGPAVAVLIAAGGGLNIDGSGTSLTASGDFVAGPTLDGQTNDGNATIQITRGGTLTVKGTTELGTVDFTDPFDPPFGADLTVDGAGSTYTVNGSLLVGNANGVTSSVTVSGGGMLKATDSGGAGALVMPGISVGGPSFVVTVGAAAGATGTMTVTGTGSDVEIDGNLAVGDAGTGTVTVAANATLSDASAYVGNQAGGNGTVTVSGTGSIWRNSEDLVAGGAGTGAVTVQQGAALTIDGDLTIGKQAGSAGTLTLQDAQSTLTFGSGEVVIGAAGGGIMTVQNGFLADFSGNEVTVGDEATGVGSLTVTDADTLMNTGNLTIASSGAGALLVRNSAELHTLGDATLGENLGQGLATVDGAKWAIDGGLTVGGSGTGEVDVTDAGTLRVSGEEVTLGENTGSSGVLAFSGAGVIADHAGKMTIGASGAGTLSVLGGASIELGAIAIGEQAGGAGTLKVDGGGGLHLMGDLTAGGLGDATLSVSGGSTLTIDGGMTMGEGATGSNTVRGTVDLASTVTVAGDLSIGGQAAATLTVENGSALHAQGNATLGELAGGDGTLTIDNPQTALRYSGKLTVGDAGAGTLAISSGGIVQPGDGGGGAVIVAAQANATGIVTVDGAGSLLQAHTMTVGGDEKGAGGTGSVTLTNGGAVTVSSDVALWPGATVDVRGGGMTIGADVAEAPVGTALVEGGGRLVGFGTVVGNLRVAGGNVVPGGDPGTLTIAGDYTQDSGTLDMGIAGPTPDLYNHVAVMGNFSLNGGLLLLDFQDGFAPAAGQTFDLISAGNAFSVAPDQVQVAGLEPGWQYQIDTSGDGLAIKSLSDAVAAPEPGTAGVALLGAAIMLVKRRRRRT
jgi:autotransporter family porin